MSTDIESNLVGRPPLSRERVLRAGVQLADEQGIGGLSMRKLAAHLGYEAMSLYNHVTNKDDLLEGMVELVVGEIAEPTAGGDWKAAIRELAVSTHEVLLRHPWTVELWTNTFPGPSRFRQMEWLLGLLVEGGLTEHLGDLGFHAINMHVAGFTQQQLGYQMDDDRLAAMSERFEREVTADRFPLMVAHKEYHEDVASQRTTHPDEFRFVLDLILDGLERARDGSR